jgi:hypothetical protein
MAMTYDDVNISDFCFAQITKAVMFSFDDSNHLLVRLSLLIINERTIPVIFAILFYFITMSLILEYVMLEYLYPI